ncbi:hypothetical protein KUF83_30015 [Streptomyces sp. BV286]|uniref:hypothetical protein n=1 Tax=Streptomyces sp. BV286 TaxID=2849672 RepID=UPI001C2E059D|nr:hypothetical protein [Streptomyces sp. BV286]MBV1940772.1 hypothetical protein [Streptomyces sp. BV286]
MPEGMQAGRLEVTVVAALDGFAQELRTKVETAAEGLAAKVKLEVVDKGLRKRLRTAVKEASKGLTAKVNVRVDHEGLRGELDDAARRVADSDVRIPVRPDGDGSSGGGLLGRIRQLLTRAQGEADQTPVHVPLQFSLPNRRGRRRFRMIAMGAIVSLLQPAVAMLTQYGAGLTAMAGAAAPAVGVLEAVPGLIAAAGTAAIGTVVAFSGFGEALGQTLKAQGQLAEGTKLTEAQQQALDQSLNKLSTSARASVKTVASLSGAWRGMKQSVQERFFSKVADEIRPLSNAVLPLLKGALGDAAGQMGNLAKRGADAMQSGPFARDFKTVAASNSRVIGNLTDGTANLAAATGHFLVASGPFVQRVAEAGERTTLWLRASAQAGRETGSLARFLDHAAEKAKQLGRTTVDLGKGLAGVGRAGMDTGNQLLNGLEGTMARFNRWANSDAGQFKMKEFFADAGPTFHELNMLVGDLMRGLGRMATDSGVTDLVRQIRVELMPAVGAFLNAIGGSVGPAIIAVISNVASAIASISSAGFGLGTLLMALNGLLQTFNGLMNVVPGLGTAIGVFLGALLMLKVAAAVSRGVTGLGTAIRNVGTVATTSAAGVATQTTLWQRMNTAYTTTASSGTRLAGSMSAVRVAAGGMRTAASGLVGAFGGPLAAALTVATIGIGLWASSQEKAARATEAHRERVNSLSSALQQSGGAIDANVRAQAVQLLQDTKLADGKGKLTDVMRGAGVNLTTLTDAYLEQGTSLKELQKQLQETADAGLHWETTAAGAVQVYDDQGLAAARAVDALGSINGELKESQKRHKELNEAINNSSATGTDSYTRLQAAVQTFSDTTKTADERTNALKTALDALKGNAQSVHDAQAQLNQVMLSINDTMDSSAKKADGWGKALLDSNGLVDTSTRNGQTLNTQLGQLRDSMLSVSTAAIEAGEKSIIPMSQAMDTSRTAMENARAKAIELAMSLGMTQPQAKALADQMGFIPDHVTTMVSAIGVPAATAEVLGLQGKLDGLAPSKSIQIEAPTFEARTQLEALGFTFQRIPGSKNVVVTAPTGGARASISTLAQDIAAAPSKKKVTVEAIIRQATGDLKSVQDKVAGLPKGKSIEVKTPTKTAQAALKDLGYKIENVDKGGKTVKITAPNRTPLAQVQAIQSKINGLTGRTVHVTVQYRESGKPSVVRTHADGGIVHYANGGIRAATNRIKAFAAGAERHIAQIGKPGEMRIWNEPETQGEAYLPLARSKRKRSEAILGEVARMFGGTVVYPDRALRAYANGAVAMYRGSTAARTVTAPRASVPQGNTALVGGDLNLNMTSEPMSPSEALGDAMFELRRIRRGGAYATG